jgi:hypothetical protein
MRGFFDQIDISDLGPRYFSAGGKPAQRTGNLGSKRDEQECERGRAGYRVGEDRASGQKLTRENRF